MDFGTVLRTLIYTLSTIAYKYDWIDSVDKTKYIYIEDMSPLAEKRLMLYDHGTISPWMPSQKDLFYDKWFIVHKNSHIAMDRDK